MDQLAHSEQASYSLHMGHSISNRKFSCFSCRIALLHQNSPAVEFGQEKIEGNLRRVNMEPSVDFKRANTESSVDFRRANTEPSVDFRRANTEPSVDFRKANTELSVHFSRANTETF